MSASNETRQVLIIDPGMETGIVWMSYTPDSLPKIGRRHQIPGGLNAMVEYLPPDDEWGPDGPALVVEKFSPRPGARSWRLKELEPIRIEGMLEYRYGSRIVWRKPEQRKLIGTLPRTEEFLRAKGYWHTPSMVGRPDANDVNAAIMHGIGYLRDQAHIPTIEMLIDYGDTLTEELL